MTKLLVIIGITGNQGGSVAVRFLKDPTYRIRGITRNPSSPRAVALAAQGVELVRADLDDDSDPSALTTALAGANLVFSVTDYWEPFFRPDCRAKAAELGISCREYAGRVEERQGRRVADAVAAAAVATLDENGFVVSTLSYAERCSGGKLRELYHFDAKARVFPGYVRERWPELARKMSCVQTGFFMSSYKLVPQAYFAKAADGAFEMRFPTAPDKPVPQLDVNADMGAFVYAVSKLPPGKSYMAEGTTCSWSEYMRLWSEVTGKPARYQQVTLQQMIDESPDKEFGREVGDMFLYSSEPGYDGGDESLLKAEDIRKLGVEYPMTSLEDWMKKQDWSAVLSA
ncbi:NmrA-like family protein [Lasiodiplodia theobromae]|uniref:NmrA-like family protein n=1 Tax=Lasiodiplodia theobromae TaxID=45133 RepID=UPI0015C3DD97|nr:NmrA-like family protein [Lasiodiplodia theobromae]KAF4539861.1 NmrA-like family protein [Lasiodiplodia theobromae]